MIRIDEYELKARTAPGLIVTLPVLAAAIFAVPQITGWRMFTTTGVLGMALVYGLGRLAQALGDSIEPRLWKDWDGPPSTRLLRHRDATFGQALKDKIRAATANRLGAGLPTLAEEEADPTLADNSVFDAFRQVRQLLRQRDPSGLWHRHNAEYGFCRNLLGCRGLWAILATLGTGISLMCASYRHTPLVNPGTVIGGLSVISALYMGWSVLPAATKRVADNYAESAWLAFLHLDHAKAVWIPQNGKLAKHPPQEPGTGT